MKVTNRIATLLLAALLAFTTACAADEAVAPELRRSGGTGEPQLLVCPSSATVSTTELVSLGGGLLSADGTLLFIPKRALLAPQAFVLSVPASQYMEIEAHAVGFDRFDFAAPVIISIDYSRCDRSATRGRRLSVWHIDSGTKQLLENMGGINDPFRRRITFPTNHFSGYAIAY